MSTLPSNLHKLGYPTLTAIDFSSVCISTMSTLRAFLDPPITWLTMDVRTMPFAADSVNIAIDKGALDDMLCGSLLDLADEVRANAKARMDQVARVSKRDGGKWLYVMGQQLGFLTELSKRSGGRNVDVEVLGEQGGLQYHGFVMAKSE
jgi:hypothetical protein